MDSMIRKRIERILKQGSRFTKLAIDLGQVNNPVLTESEAVKLARSTYLKALIAYKLSARNVEKVCDECEILLKEIDLERESRNDPEYMSADHKHYKLILNRVPLDRIKHGTSMLIIMRQMENNGIYLKAWELKKALSISDDDFKQLELQNGPGFADKEIVAAESLIPFADKAMSKQISEAMLMETVLPVEMRQ